MSLYQQLKNIYHLLQALFWRAVYGMPDKDLHIIGITGTNGKTTTSYLVASILQYEFGEKTIGMLTTVSFRVGGREEINTTKMTTLPSRLVYQYLSRMKKEGVTHVVLEMTSHALDQNRLYGITLDGAIILNIEREHLDYHNSMEEYAAAKAKIVHYLKPHAPLVGKSSDERVKRILDSAADIGHHVFSFTGDEALNVVASLSGDVNKENTLAAQTIAQALGISDTAITAGITAVRQVPGRMQWILAQNGVRFLIDYAVTPDALQRLYAFVKNDANGKRVFGLLGAAGLRDRGKRADMARVVKKHTDFLVLTREDPWTENEEQIFSDLEQGLDKQDSTWQRIIDRKQALACLFSKAASGDVIVVTGKGAETGMAIGKKIIPWNEAAVIAEVIEEGGSHVQR